MNENPILVTGGTGVLGREVLQRLLETGHPVRVLRCVSPARRSVPYRAPRG